jgi:protein O-mannosyl-transferase
MDTSNKAVNSNPFRSRVIPFLIAAGTFVLYVGALGFDFLNFDDLTNVVENYHLMNLHAQDFKWMFTGTAVSDYKPAVWLSYAADRLVWGLNPAGFHLTNILLHVANTLLVYWISLFLIRRYGKSAWSKSLAVAGAALVSVLFSVYPQRVESVVWISERKDVLYGFFYLASLGLYLRWAVGTCTRRRWVYLGFNLLGFLSLLSKPMAVSLPVNMLLLDVLVLRRAESWRHFHNSRAAVLVAEKLPLLLAALFISIRTMSDHLADESFEPLLPWTGRSMGGAGPAQTLWMFPYSLVFYLKKILWPVELSPLYPPRPDIGLSTPCALSAVLVTVVTIGLAIMWVRGSRWPFFLWIFFVVSILPALPSRIVCDRFTYLPSLGLIGLAVGIWLTAAARGLRVPGARVLLVALPLAFAGWLAVLNWTYAGVWGNSISLWGYTVAKSPSANAYHLLATAHLAVGEYRRALEAENQALKYSPDMGEAWSGKGAILIKLNRLKKATECLSQATRLPKPSWKTYLNLGHALILQGQTGAAITNLLRALEFAPDSFATHLGLARAYWNLGQTDEALFHYRSALATAPSITWRETARQELEAKRIPGNVEP